LSLVNRFLAWLALQLLYPEKWYNSKRAFAGGSGIAFVSSWIIPSGFHVVSLRGFFMPKTGMHPVL
jgi:hypothetical protein